MRMCADRNGEARREGRRLLGVTHDEFVLVYFGYLYPGKGIETLLQAFGLVAQQHKCRLVMIGGDSELILEK